MKKKLNMVALSKNEIKKSMVYGGSCNAGFTGDQDADGDVEECSCGCYYSGDEGGSSTSANNSANTEGGLSSIPR